MFNEELIRSKYQEMKRLGKTEDFLDEKAFGGIKVFVNKKPMFSLGSYPISETEILYVGSETL